MPVINIIIHCHGPRVLTPELCEWQCLKNCKKFPTLGEKEQRHKQTTASLNDCFPGRAASPFFTSAIHRFHVSSVGTVYFIYFLFIGRLPPPSAKLIFVECEFTASNSSLFYSFSDFMMVNSQVDVFNFEMNVYCRVSVLFSMLLRRYPIYMMFTPRTYVHIVLNWLLLKYKIYVNEMLLQQI